jgi:pimeloyl-ACP methyl ester carboxylesterase
MKKTIMLVHGAWVTPDCWENFRTYFESKGYACIVPAWPYLNRPVAELRESPDPKLKYTTIKSLVDHYEQLIKNLPEPPILIGHSFGGLIVQMLIDRGLGVAGIAIDAGPPRGVVPSLRAIRSAAPVLFSWFGWRRVLTMSFKSFSETFANRLGATEQRSAYENYIVPAPGRIYFQAAIGIGNGVDFANPTRSPLLLIAGEDDRTSTPSMVEAMYRKYSKSPMQTDIMRFPKRSHWLIAEPGWEEVAAKSLEWVTRLAKK